MVNPGGIFGTTSTVDVLVNGTQTFSATNSGGGTTLTWQQFTTSFTANSSQTTLEFLNGDPSNDTSNGLDNIHVEVAAPDVPEPAWLALFSAGLLALGMIRDQLRYAGASQCPTRRYRSDRKRLG